MIDLAIKVDNRHYESATKDRGQYTHTCFTKKRRGGGRRHPGLSRWSLRLPMLDQTTRVTNKTDGSRNASSIPVVNRNTWLATVRQAARRRHGRKEREAARLLTAYPGAAIAKTPPVEAQRHAWRMIQYQKPRDVAGQCRPSQQPPCFDEGAISTGGKEGKRH